MSENSATEVNITQLTRQVERLEMELSALKARQPQTDADIIDRLVQLEEDLGRTFIRVRLTLGFVLIWGLVLVPAMIWAPWFFLLFVAIVA